MPASNIPEPTAAQVAEALQTIQQCGHTPEHMAQVIAQLRAEVMWLRNIVHTSTQELPHVK